MMMTMNSSSGDTAQQPGAAHLATAVYLGLLAVMGGIGNVLVLATVARMAQMRHMTYILVSNLSAVGLLNCVLTIPMHMVHMVVGSSLWEGGDSMTCKVLAHVNYGLVLCMLINSAAIAISRYHTVTSKHSIRQQTVPTAKIVRLIFFIWALPIIVAISASPFLGFNVLLWDCFFEDVDHAFWYMNMALSVPALISALCMLIAYVLIIKKVRDSRLKISNLFQKAGSLTDNALPENREERTVSESEQRAEADARNLDLMIVRGPSHMGAIRIFTTMIPDESLNTPSTSYTTHGCTASPGFGELQRVDDVNSSAPGKSPGPPCYVQSPSPSEHAGFMDAISGKVMDTLSVPSHFSVSQEDVNTPIHSESSTLSGCSSLMMSRENSLRRRRFRKELKLTMHLFLAFVLFCLFYLPLCFAHMVHSFHFLGEHAWLLLYTLALSFASNSWLIYALLNRDFRRAFQALLHGQRSF